MSFIQVIKHEQSADAMELPLEDDQTLDMATLTSQFPHAIGLKYKAESGAWRGLKVNGSTISHPGGAWSEYVKYVVTYNTDNKRKADDDIAEKPKRAASLLKAPSDLVVLNMPYTISEDDMRAYFDKFGELSFVQLKKKPDGSSRGYGFIRYVDMQDQKSCLAETHVMGDRTLEVKIPQSKAAGMDEVVSFTSGAQRYSRRIHVGNVTARISRKDLEEYFGQFGPITDVFIPKETASRKNPNFAFLTFDDENDARALVESSQPHLVHGDTLNVMFASPIQKAGEKKSADAAFNEMMDTFMGQAFTGKFGNDKPRSSSESVGMAMALMKRWMETNGGSSHRYRQEDYAQAWGGSSNLSGYGTTSFSDTSAYGYGGSGKYV